MKHHKQHVKDHHQDSYLPLFNSYNASQAGPLSSCSVLLAARRRRFQTSSVYVGTSKHVFKSIPEFLSCALHALALIKYGGASQCNLCALLGGFAGRMLQEEMYLA